MRLHASCDESSSFEGFDYPALQGIDTSGGWSGIGGELVLTVTSEIKESSSFTVTANTNRKSASITVYVNVNEDGTVTLSV